MMFFSSRMVLSTPPSFVNSYLNVLSLMMAPDNSTPIRLHVPEDRYAHLPALAGTPKTAEAVSCDPTAITGILPQPISLATPLVRLATTAPGRMTFGMILIGRPNSSKIGLDHLPVFISIIWEVLARVYSPKALPHRK